MSKDRKEEHHDSDIHKGAVEDDSLGAEHNTSLRGQLNHRNQDEMIKDNDSDYPEPGSNPEHTGERNTQESGHAQKQNQNDKKEDPLAS